MFPFNIESSGAKYLLFTKGPQTNPNNKLGWIGYAGDNSKMVFRNAKGNEMTFETNNIFSTSLLKALVAVKEISTSFLTMMAM